MNKDFTFLGEGRMEVVEIALAEAMVLQIVKEGRGERKNRFEKVGWDGAEDKGRRRRYEELCFEVD